MTKRKQRKLHEYNIIVDALDEYYKSCLACLHARYLRTEEFNKLSEDIYNIRAKYLKKHKSLYYSTIFKLTHRKPRCQK